MNNTQIAIASLLVASAGVMANAETDLTLARSYELANTSSSYDSLLSESNLSNIKVSAQVQARYQYNATDTNQVGGGGNTDNDDTMGFSIRRAKVGISGDITDNMKGYIKFAFNRNSGAAALEDAYADWAINDDLTLRVGQFKSAVLREENVSSSRQLASDRGVVNETFNQDFSQGIEAHFGGDSWRAMVGFNDGFNTDNTAFNSGSEADYAFNARAEFLFGDAEWDAFKQFTSWRGANSGGMLGAAIAYQSMGDTNPATAMSSDMTTATLDFSYVSDGWNLFAAGVWRSADNGTVSNDDYGFVLQGGVFLSDQDELFARWNAILSDENRAPNDEDFNALTFGWNHYFVAESHAAKFTLDLSYYLDATTTSSIVSTSDGHNLLPDAGDGQIGLTAQMQFLF